MIKHFAKFSSSDNVQDTEVVWSQKKSFKVGKLVKI